MPVSYPRNGGGGIQANLPDRKVRADWKARTGVMLTVKDGKNDAHLVSHQIVYRDCVCRMVVRGRVKCPPIGCIGFARKEYDPEKNDETRENTAVVDLDGGTTTIQPLISGDGVKRVHPGHMAEWIPKLTPFNLALRVEKDTNCAQVQFGDDPEWRSLGVLVDEDVPVYTYLHLQDGVSVCDFRLERVADNKTDARLLCKATLSSINAAIAAGDFTAAVALFRSDDVQDALRNSETSSAFAPAVAALDEHAARMADEVLADEEKTPPKCKKAKGKSKKKRGVGGADGTDGAAARDTEQRSLELETSFAELDCGGLLAF